MYAREWAKETSGHRKPRVDFGASRHETLPRSRGIREPDLAVSVIRPNLDCFFF